MSERQIINALNAWLMSDNQRKLLKDILVYTNAFLIVFLPQSVNSDKINSEVCYIGSLLSKNQ